MTQKAVTSFQSKEQADNLQAGAQNKAIGDLQKNALSGGVLISNVTLTAGSNSVSHKLSQKPQGWFLVSPKGAASIYEESSDKTTLTLNASADVKVALFVF